MNIVINAFSARRGGGQTYLMNLLTPAGFPENVAVYLLASRSLAIPEDPRIKKIPIAWPTENPLMRSIWEKLFLPRLLKNIGADILFCPGGLINTNPPKGCRTATMFRNMMPFDLVQRKKYPYGLMRMRNWILERALFKSMLKADLVIFISEYAKSIIEARAGKPLKNAVTIPHGISGHFKLSDTTAIERPAWLPREEYILYVSILDVYKSQLEIVRGYHLLKQIRATREKLILAGHTSSDYGKMVRNEIQRLGLGNDVILPGNIPYAELPAVYRHAKINVFASECENCPNILLEALGAGRPLLVSNRPPMPEFGGDAVEYFDPTSPVDFSNKIRSMIDNVEQLSILSEKARKRSQLYDWKTTTDLTWNALSKLARQ